MISSVDNDANVRIYSLKLSVAKLAKLAYELILAVFLSAIRLILVPVKRRNVEIFFIDHSMYVHVHICGSTTQTTTVHRNIYRLTSTYVTRARTATFPTPQ